jgi:uncharacterized Zn finger protein (UPF0148 family)
MEKKTCTKCGEDKPLTEFYTGRTKCKFCYSEQKKEYREKNKDDINEKNKTYYYENHNRMLEKKKKYRENNTETIKSYNTEYFKTYEKKRSERDILYRIGRSLHNSVRCCLRQKKFPKNSRTYEMLGCTYEEFKTHIELKFEPWMSWDNYGLYNGKECYGWDYDHIIPRSLAKSEDELIKLLHYSNLQPLCSYANRVIKRDSLDWE